MTKLPDTEQSYIIRRSAAAALRIWPITAKAAAAWLRGLAIKTGTPAIDSELPEMPLEVLADGELAAIVEIGEKTGQKLYPFKTEKAELPRVRQVLGFLHGIEFESLLDVAAAGACSCSRLWRNFPQYR